jgi:hypothetical protein
MKAGLRPRLNFSTPKAKFSFQGLFPQAKLNMIKNKVVQDAMFTDSRQRFQHPAGLRSETPSLALLLPALRAGLSSFF